MAIDNHCHMANDIHRYVVAIDNRHIYEGKTMSIKTWPVSERPREKLLGQGAASLSDAELLAIFLRTGIKDKSAVELARDLLIHFGGLGKLLNVSLKEIKKVVKGIGQVKYVQLQAVLELSRRYLFENIKQSNALSNAKVVKKYLRLQLGAKQEENFGCLFLDAKNKIIAFKTLFNGSLTYTNIYPREIVKSALEKQAVSVIFSHNHPSGDPTPSQDDIKLTERLRAMLSFIEVRVLDHIIVGKFKEFSFAENGLL